jgi:hypothetical protein
MEAFQSESLYLFHKGGHFSPIGKHGSLLDQLKTFNDWHNTSGTRFGDSMKDMIPQVESAIKSYINEHYHYSLELHTLATHCLYNIIACSWISSSSCFASRKPIYNPNYPEKQHGP